MVGRAAIVAAAAAGRSGLIAVQHGIHHIPLINAAGRLAGLIAAYDAVADDRRQIDAAGPTAQHSVAEHARIENPATMNAARACCRLAVADHAVADHGRVVRAINAAGKIVCEAQTGAPAGASVTDGEPAQGCTRRQPHTAHRAVAQAVGHRRARGGPHDEGHIRSVNRDHRHAIGDHQSVGQRFRTERATARVIHPGRHQHPSTRHHRVCRVLQVSRRIRPRTERRRVRAG
ncbi:MAG: hypothetical protein BWX70_03038 [Verrucomicrobia bacterium ADurb.Bin070]|nr:MAG: hypothetical protein BWX70_03038 [Verrucomicrobia bacterium ADurb.Bin070]